MKCPHCGYQIESIEWGFGQVQCPSCLHIIDLAEVGIDRWIGGSDLESYRDTSYPSDKSSQTKNHTTETKQHNSYFDYDDTGV